MATMDLQEKVEILLDLLDDIEKCISSDDSSLSSEVGTHLANRLYTVADLADRRYNVVDISDESQFGSQPGSQSGSQPWSQSGSQSGSVLGQGGASTQVKQESGSVSAPSVGMAVAPPPGTVQAPPTGAIAKQVVAPPPGTVQVRPPGAIAKQERMPSPPLIYAPPPTKIQPPPPPPAYNRFTNPQPAVLDEPARKRRREAEALVRGLEKTANFSCGISYQGDDKEKKFSDGIKNDLKRHLGLNTHRHLFRYMAWATMDRIECQHCRKCPNSYP